MSFSSVLGALGAFRELGLLNPPVDGGCELANRVRLGRRQRLQFDVGELDALFADLREHAGGVVEEAAAKETIGGQPANQGLDVAVSHARRYCGSSAEDQRGAPGLRQSPETLAAISFNSRKSMKGDTKNFGGNWTPGEVRTAGGSAAAVRPSA